MNELQNVNTLKGCQPYFIYKRVQLTSPEGYFFHQVDYGFWYLLRRIHVKFPEIDTKGIAFYPQLNLYMIEKGNNKIPQNVPIPFRLFSTPTSEGVQNNAAGQLTATEPKNAKLINKVFPFRDNIELYISGQNPIGNPPFVDIVCIGYLIPENKLKMWKGAE